MLRRFLYLFSEILIVVVVLLLVFLWRFSAQVDLSVSINFFTFLLAVLALVYATLSYKIRQLSLLDSCRQEIALSLKTLTGFKKELQKNSLPLYFIKEVSAETFSVNLDGNFLLTNATPLKENLFKVNDKIKLVNDYLRIMLDAYFDHLKKRKFKNEKEAWETFTAYSQIYTYILPRMNGAIYDLQEYLLDSSCMLKKQYP